MMNGVEQEASYQDRLLGAVYGTTSCDDASLSGAILPCLNGINAYRNNARLNAVQAMSLMFPTLHALLGADDFYALARLFWLAKPPTRGDWSQYGVDFGDWISTTNAGGVLDSLPQLADLARLEDATNRSQDAVNSVADLSTLRLLENDPSTLRIVLHPSVRILDLNYDVVTYRAALLASHHATLQTMASAVFVPAPPAQLCHALIARKEWRAVATMVDTADARFIRQCLGGSTVLQAHAAASHANPNFDAAQWLAAAIPAQWLLRVEPI